MRRLRNRLSFASRPTIVLQYPGKTVNVMFGFKSKFNLGKTVYVFKSRPSQSRHVGCNYFRLFKMKVRAKTGDVFQIPITGTQFCFGQVVINNKGVLRVVTFDGLHNSDDIFTIDKVLNCKIILLTDTMDAKIWNGDWKVYSNSSIVDNDLPRPNFKVGLDPVFITNYFGQKLRVATEKEESFYDHKFSVAPIRVQNAMKAYFKFADWQADFDKLTYNYCAEKSVLTI